MRRCKLDKSSSYRIACSGRACSHVVFYPERGSKLPRYIEEHFHDRFRYYPLSLKAIKEKPRTTNELAAAVGP